MGIPTAFKDLENDKYAIGPSGVICIRLVIEDNVSERPTKALPTLENGKFLENSNGETAIRAFCLED